MSERTFVQLEFSWKDDDPLESFSVSGDWFAAIIPRFHSGDETE